MWQRFTQVLKTTLKGRIVGGVVSRQPPQSIRTLLSYSSSLTTAPIKQLGHHITRPSTKFGSPSSSSQFHSSSSSRSRLSPSRLPRPPAIPGRITDVGLGTARKFSTARPIFQHLIENVPVTGRTLYELDLDIRKKQARAEALLFTKAKKSAGVASSVPQISSSIFRPQAQASPPLSTLDENDTQFDTMSETGEQFDNYFTPPPFTSVATYLRIPLVPPPASHPYSQADSAEDLTDSPALLSFSSIASEHILHATHAARVSSLYARLDTNRVWERGASCEALYDDSSGLCTALLVKFDGWTEEDVRSVLGLAGDGWCTIRQEAWIDQQTSFIMPTVDLSSTLPPPTEPSDTPATPWDDLMSIDALSQIEVDVDWADFQPEADEWSMMEGNTDEDFGSEGSIPDLSSFSSGSVVVVT